MKHNRKIMYVMTLIVFTSLCFGVGERLWLVSMYPYGNYGLAYNPSNDCVYYTNFYERDIYIRTADSNCTSVGTIPAPNNDSACVDIKYCAYDNTFWVLCKSTLRVYKIDQSGNVLRWFSSPANDYPAGLAWKPSTLYKRPPYNRWDSGIHILYRHHGYCYPSDESSYNYSLVRTARTCLSTGTQRTGSVPAQRLHVFQQQFLS
jgi:hypothetical protein